MDVEPLWLTFADLTNIHERQIKRFGGLGGIRDENLVHSAAAAAINLYNYEGVTDPLALGVHLCAAVLQSHPFNDGNKRTATAAMIEFLALNGWDLVIPDDERDAPLLGRWIENLASGTLSNVQLYGRLYPFLHERP